MPQDDRYADGMQTKPHRVLAEPDAHGQAALLLAESMLHVLVETGALTSSQAMSVVQTAAEVKIEVAAAIHESKGRMEQSLALLAAMKRGFEADGDNGGK